MSVYLGCCVMTSDRVKTGRTKIDNPFRAGSYSRRGVSAIRLRCSHCGHHKAFDKPRGKVCTKCGTLQKKKK